MTLISYERNLTPGYLRLQSCYLAGLSHSKGVRVPRVTINKPPIFRDIIVKQKQLFSIYASAGGHDTHMKKVMGPLNQYRADQIDN